MIEKLRALVKKTCHTPLLVAGAFVAVDELSRRDGDGLRKTIATEDELLRALEYEIRTLQHANAYLRTQLPSPLTDTAPRT